MNNRLVLLLLALWASIFLLIKNQINYVKDTHKLNLQIYSLVQTQPKTIIKKIPEYIYVPSEGSIEIKPKDTSKSLEDVVEIKVKKYGFTSKIGGHISIFPIGLGIDTKLFYINRIGLIGGLTYIPYNPVFFLSPMAGLSYKLDRLPLIENTELFIGYGPLSINKFLIGLRINL